MTTRRPMVEVVEWSPLWQTAFEAARSELARTLPESASIEHIGSTSVPGLAAKPILDILVVVGDVTAARREDSGLASLGYIARKWEDDPDHLFFIRDTDGVRTEHLHVFPSGSPRPQQNRDFRDYLIAHPDAAARYGAAKIASAAAHPDSRRDYAEGKRVVFDQLQRQADEWAARGRARL